MTDEIIRVGQNSIKDIFSRVFDTLINTWHKEIIQKGQELTRFYAL